jgi:S1-C subfamily serine protease
MIFMKESFRFMKKMISLCIMCMLVTAIAACRPNLLGSPEPLPPEKPWLSVVRVKVTRQGYHFHRPWQQREPATQTAIGVVVPGNRVLVTAILVADHRYIELETINTQEKRQAEVDVVDYEANLALLKPLDPDFLANYQPMQLSSAVAAGDMLTIWQVKPDGDVVPTPGKVTSVELTPFSMDNYFLAYRLDSTLQYHFGNLTLPAVKGERQLAGLVLRYSPQGQAIEVISTPVIRHFLADAQNAPYQGFPTAGFHFGPTTDPQLRRYIGLPEDVSGIYIQKILKGGPADRAELMEGDVIFQMGDFSISNSGQYGHPHYGRTSLLHLIRTGYFVGDRLPVRIFRKGERLNLQIVLDHRGPEEYLVPPYIIDRAPRYLIAGGLVIQELSLSYLREYGKEWASRAPIHLLFYNQNQDYLSGEQREKIVIISNVIPTPFTIGYEDLSDLVVSRVNGRNIFKLADVARALQTPVNGFHKFEVEQPPSVIYLDSRELPAIQRLIEERYHIPTTTEVGE